MSELENLLERVKAAAGPDRNLDEAVWLAVEPNGRVPADLLLHYTARINAAVALVERALPGWCWKVGTCSVSDDAWLAPDFNSPVHGERLKAQFLYLVAGRVFDAGVDIDRRPSGQPALALLEALLTALLEVERASAPEVAA